MQWRIALSWISGYFIFWLFTPVLFKYHGAVVAGQMGMTWSAISVVSTIAGSWLSPKVPQFGMLIAQRKFQELDRLFWHVTRIVVGVTVALSVAIWLAIYLFNIFDIFLAKRLLQPLPAGIFIFTQCVVASTIPFAAYMRAHKKEPLLYLSLLSGLLTGLSTFFLGMKYSVMGMAVGYICINMIIAPLVILVWYRCRKEWHS